MPTQRRHFTGPDDLVAMQRLCSRVWTPTSRFHAGQLTWSRYYRPVDPAALDATEAISLWEHDGEVVGFAWAEAPDWLEWQVHPDHPEVATEAVEWFEEWSDADEQATMVVEGDHALEDALTAAGFVRRPEEPFFTHHLVALDALPPVPAVEGYSFRHVEPGEARERAACHAAAWSDDSPSKVDETAYGQLMRAWPYRHDLDWVAVDPSGEMVASALVWLDPAHGVGLVEPVGCATAHRGRGLAGATVLAALHHLRGLGGRAAQVTPRGDDDYPGPRRLYEALGFRPTVRVLSWSRSTD